MNLDYTEGYFSAANFRCSIFKRTPRNVADVVKPPRLVPKEMVALSTDETRRLLDAAAEDRLEALYVLAVHTGMRQGELLALRWQDVDM